MHPRQMHMHRRDPQHDWHSEPWSLWWRAVFSARQVLSLWGVLCAAGALVLAQPAWAQEPTATWTVVHTSDGGGTTRLDQAADELARAMKAARWSVLPPSAAAERFTDRSSAPGTRIASAESAQVLEAAQRLQLLVATERYREAERLAEGLMEKAQALKRVVGRDAQVTEALFRGCLYRVQGALQQKNREEARARAIECRRIAPYATVVQSEFPPNVVGLMAEVDAELRRRAQPLKVRSTPNGCRTFLNGRPIGSTPAFVAGLIQGSYGVRVDCHPDKPGRVHSVQIGHEPVELWVDTLFDRVVNTEGALRLRYSDPYMHAARRLKDGIEVATTVGVQELVLLEALGPTRVRIDRVNVARQSVVSSILLPWSADAHFGDVQDERITETLAAGRSLDMTAAPPQPMAAWVPPAPLRLKRELGPLPAADTPSAPSHGPHWLAWTGTALGALSLTIGWALLPLYLDRSQELANMDLSQPGYPQAESETNRALAFSYGTAIAGSAVLSASLPFVLPERSKTPAWAWASGVAGVAFVATGVALIAVDGNETEIRLVDPEQGFAERSYRKTAQLGGLFLITAAPLFTVPLTYLLRDTPAAGGGVELGPRRAALTWQGRF